MLEMIDDAPRGQRRNASAKGSLHAGMAHGEAAHIELVIEPRRLAPRMRGLVAATGNDGLGHQFGGVHRVLARQAQARGTDEHPTQMPGIGIDQQLVRIEEQTLVRIVGAVCPQPIAGAWPHIGDQAGMNIVFMHIQFEAPDLLVLLVEQADPDGRGAFRIDGEIDTLGGRHRAELLGVPAMGHKFGFHGQCQPR